MPTKAAVEVASGTGPGGTGLHKALQVKRLTNTTANAIEQTIFFIFFLGCFKSKLTRATAESFSGGQTFGECFGRAKTRQDRHPTQTQFHFFQH
jgi:hypothetical protein